jgi:hypothetical protein
MQYKSFNFQSTQYRASEVSHSENVVYIPQRPLQVGSGGGAQDAQQPGHEGSRLLGLRWRHQSRGNDCLLHFY